MARFSPVLTLYRGLTRLAPALPEALSRHAHRAQGADPARLAERLRPAAAPRPAGRLVWIHAASVGEVAGVAGIANDLARDGVAVLLTTFTATGAAAAGRLVPAATHRFLPADSRRAARAFVAAWQPDLAVFTESDLWPNLTGALAAAAIPLALVGARASRTRQSWPRLSAAILSRFDAITAQDQIVHAELLALGLDPARITVTGDLKAAADPLPADPAALADLRALVGQRPVWIAASTHADDEAPVLAAQAMARARHPGLLLILMPRHPARAPAIVAAVSATVSGGASGGAPLRSRNQAPGPDDGLWIVDTLGETGLFYRLAPLVFLGGSFGAEGGHNPFEPAALGAAVLTGPGTAHQQAAFAGLIAAGAAARVADAAELGATVARLIGTKALAAMQGAALAHLAQSRNARTETGAILRRLLAPSP